MHSLTVLAILVPILAIVYVYLPIHEKQEHVQVIKVGTNPFRVEINGCKGDMITAQHALLKAECILRLFKEENIPREIESYVVHPDYQKEKNVKFDLGVVKIKTPIKELIPLCRPEYNLDDEPEDIDDRLLDYYKVVFTHEDWVKNNTKNTNYCKQKV